MEYDIMKTKTHITIGKKAITIVKPNTVTQEDINELILGVKENHGFISIKGYTTAKGEVANYLVQPLGDNGYINIINKSLVELENVKNEKGFSQDVFEQAKIELETSFNKTINNEHNKTDNYNKEKKGFYGHSKSDSLYIKDIVIIKKVTITKGEKKIVKSAEKTLAKKYIRNKLSIGKYQGTFKLDSSKFEELSFNNTTITNS